MPLVMVFGKVVLFGKGSAPLLWLLYFGYIDLFFSVE